MHFEKIFLDNILFKKIKSVNGENNDKIKETKLKTLSLVFDKRIFLINGCRL